MSLVRYLIASSNILNLLFTQLSSSLPWDTITVSSACFYVLHVDGRWHFKSSCSQTRCDCSSARHITWLTIFTGRIYLGNDHCFQSISHSNSDAEQALDLGVFAFFSRECSLIQIFRDIVFVNQCQPLGSLFRHMLGHVCPASCNTLIDNWSTTC